MEHMSRRSALSMAIATVAAAGTAPALAQGSALSPGQGEALPTGVSRQNWGKSNSMIPAYKSVSMIDVIYQPGAKSANPSMPNDMVCHVPEGELRVTRKDGTNFTAKKGDVWTCMKGEDEALENTGKAVAIMRVINLLTA